MNLIVEFAHWFFGRIGDAILPDTPRPTMPTETNPLVAICVGHSREGDDGATSVDGTSEWTFNADLAKRISGHLSMHGIKSFIVDRYEGHGYGAATRWVAAHVEQRHASCAVELHFNAASGTATGHEWLFWGSSARSRALAGELRQAFVDEFPLQRDRGAKAKASGDRGGEFLRLTHCPAVIAEPFFGDTPGEWQFAIANRDKIAAAIAHGIQKFSES